MTAFTNVPKPVEELLEGREGREGLGGGERADLPTELPQRVGLPCRELHWRRGG